MFKRVLVIVPIAVLALVLTPQLAFAGSPHFISSATQVTRTDNTLTVSGKEAGLGDEAQVHIIMTATALCLNNGGHHPQAVNKMDVTVAGDFPVQNGKTDFSLSMTAVFTPDCSPPMTVGFTDIVVMDTTNDLTMNVPGTF